MLLLLILFSHSFARFFACEYYGSAYSKSLPTRYDEIQRYAELERLGEMRIRSISTSTMFAMPISLCWTNYDKCGCVW